MLEGDPIELAKMILALGDLLQRTLLGGLSLRSGAVSISDDLSEPCARRQCGAVAQPMVLEIPICMRAEV